MATRQIVTVISDLSGEPTDRENPTVRFGLDGAAYEIDLTEEEESEFRERLAPYLAASRLARSSSSSSRPGVTVTSREIRIWAAENGFEVPTRGRIPAPVREAYQATHR